MEQKLGGGGVERLQEMGEEKKPMRSKLGGRRRLGEEIDLRFPFFFNSPNCPLSFCEFPPFGNFFDLYL
jgi:hypothetical protein